MDGNFRILAIDGGGFRGVYPAHLLRRIEELFKVDWCGTFGMIAGTSTGSIIAAGLACGIPAQRILSLYEEHGHRIFCKRWLCRMGLFGSRYREKHLQSVLIDIFGDRTLGEIEIPLILPATDIGNGCVHVFKSAYDETFVRDNNVKVRDAILASCSAPTYFNPYKVGDYLLADGGLWANSPALVAVVDAKRRLGRSFEDIRVLSIGTGTGLTYYSQNVRWWKRSFGWGFATRWERSRFVDMLLNLQAQNANNMCGLLLQPHQVLRINFESDSELALDVPDEFRNLVSRSDKDFTHNAERIREFLGLPSAGRDAHDQEEDKAVAGGSGASGTQ